MWNVSRKRPVFRSVWVVLSVATGLLLYACGSRSGEKTSSGAAPAGGTQGGPSRARLFLESHPEDDAQRAERLPEIIRESGRSCRAADKVAAAGVGSWTVRCTSGQVYRVLFDRVGKLTEVRDVT